MNDEEFLTKYEELLDKDYCNCNEMNCIDNNSPRRILNIAKQLQKENKSLKNRIKETNNAISNYLQMDNRYKHNDADYELELVRRTLNSHNNVGDDK